MRLLHLHRFGHLITIALATTFVTCICLSLKSAFVTMAMVRRSVRLQAKDMENDPGGGGNIVTGETVMQDNENNALSGGGGL